jgi:hypothetical protein
MCCIDGQENKYSVLNECSRMLKYNIFNSNICGRSTNSWDSSVSAVTTIQGFLRAIFEINKTMAMKIVF